MANNDIPDKYLIPKDLRSKIKFGALTIADWAVVFGMIVLWYVLKSYLELGLFINIILFILHFIFAGFLIMRTPGNPDRPRISVMYSALFNQDDKVYKAIDYNEFVVEREEQ